MSNENGSTQKPAFKVGDRIVLAYLKDMEPGVIRKIAGDRALIDIGADQLYGEELRNLLSVEDKAEFSSQEAPKPEPSVFSKVVEKIDEVQKAEDIVHKVISSIKYENEVKDGINNLGAPEQAKAFEDPKIGNKVRKVGTQRIGTIVSVDSHTHNYRVQWKDTNIVTTNWKQELTRASE